MRTFAVTVLNFACAGLLLLALFRAGELSDMPNQLHARYWSYAIPAAVSRLDYGLNGYRGYVSVLMHFVDGGAAAAAPPTRDALIASAAKIPNVEAAGIFFFPGDEKGLEDFVAVAFALFGRSVGSFYCLYFTLLTISVGTHLLCFVRNPSLQSINLVVLAAIYAALPVLPITSELGSLLNPRAFGLLALPATVSLACLIVGGTRVRLWQVPLLVLQALIIAFVAHVRNAEVWQVGFLFCAVALAAFGWRRSQAVPRSREVRLALSWRRPAVVLLALVAGVILPFQAVMQTRFAPEYSSSKLVGKIFWHNVGIGFAVSPYFQSKYGLELSDTSMLHQVANSEEVARLGDAGRRVFWMGTYTGNWVGGDPEIQEPSAMYHVGMVRDFIGYERLAREVVFRFARENPLETLRLFVVDKPLLLIRHTINAFVPGIYNPAQLMLEDQASALQTTESRWGQRIYVHLFSVPVLLALLVVAGVFSVTNDLDRIRGLALALLAMMVGVSLAPLIATYPLIHLMASYLASLLVLILVASAMALSAVMRQAWRRTRPLGPADIDRPSGG